MLACRFLTVYVFEFKITLYVQYTYVYPYGQLRLATRSSSHKLTFAGH